MGKFPPKTTLYPQGALTSLPETFRLCHPCTAYGVGARNVGETGTRQDKNGETMGT